MISEFGFDLGGAAPKVAAPADPDDYLTNLMAQVHSAKQNENEEELKLLSKKTSDSPEDDGNATPRTQPSGAVVAPAVPPRIASAPTSPTAAAITPTAGLLLSTGPPQKERAAPTAPVPQPQRVAPVPAAQPVAQPTPPAQLPFQAVVPQPQAHIPQPQLPMQLPPQQMVQQHVPMPAQVQYLMAPQQPTAMYMQPQHNAPQLVQLPGGQMAYVVSPAAQPPQTAYYMMPQTQLVQMPGGQMGYAVYGTPQVLSQQPTSMYYGQTPFQMVYR